MKFFKNILLWLYWFPFRFFLQKLSAENVYVIAQLLGVLLFYLAHSKRAMYEKEVSFIFKNEIDHHERDEIVKKAFKVFMCNELEVLLFPILNPQNITSFVTYSGLENLDRVLLEGKGSILLFGHFGANQMIMPAIGYKGYGMCQLSAPATVWEKILPQRTFSYMEKVGMKIRTEHELSLPVKHINIFGSIKEAFLCIKRNEVLGIAIDGGWGKERTSVDFLGRAALLSLGAADISKRTKCSILPTFMVRSPTGKNQLIIEKPLEVNPDVDDCATIEGVTQHFANKLEEYVLKYPSHYIHFISLRRFMAEQGDTPLFHNDIEYRTNIKKSILSC